MRNQKPDELSFDDFDEQRNPGPEQCEIDAVIERAMSRRSFLGSGLALGTAIASGATFKAGRDTNANADTLLQFKPVAANSLDTVTIPEGFNWHVVCKWGEPLWSDAIPFDHTTRGSGASQERAMGDNNDGMHLFAQDGRMVLAVNNEYVNRRIIYANRDSKKPENADDVRKAKAGHGITIAEMQFKDGRWSIIKNASLNRRITADSPMHLSGPAAGHDLLKTAADPTGTKSLGTWNNCANGHTPWGTYLTCEENFNGYFSSSDEAVQPTSEMKRYGIGQKDWGYGWGKFDDRFDFAKTPNECNRAGYVVEIDPFDPSSTPKKRTALGRFKHENAELVIADNGHVVVYMGDDERGEFLYRFVSRDKYSKTGNNTDLLDHGTLYVAQFDDKLKGRWLALTPETTGMASQAEICVHTRQAASKVGATTMDRPEWVAAHPKRAEVYCSLTNNKNRGRKPNRGGDATPVGGPNPRAKNKYGQIVRWRPTNDDHTADTFEWDLFVVAGNPVVHDDDRKGSANVTPQNMFNSPDGLAFDNTGNLWIMTDGKYSNKGDFAGMGNNQLLIGNPDSGEIRRFMVGPKECEITGLTWSQDRKTVFIGIQHPGEKGDSHFPEGGDSAPRSSIIAIARDDGGIMG